MTTTFNRWSEQRYLDKLAKSYPNRPAEILARATELSLAFKTDVAAWKPSEKLVPLLEEIFERLDTLGDIANNVDLSGDTLTDREEDLCNGAQERGDEQGQESGAEYANDRWRDIVQNHLDKVGRDAELNKAPYTIANRWDAETLARAILADA